MTEPVTTNIALIVPNTGDLPGSWSTGALNPDFNAIDGFFGGVQTISVSNAPVTLTAPAGSITPAGGPTQANNAVLKFSGTLTGNVQVTLPLPGYYIIDTSGLSGYSFVLTLRAVGSGLVIGIPWGGARHVYNDGTNVYYVNLPEIGEYVDYATTGAAPAWITACTVPPFLLCDGSTFNATTYPVLNAYLGGNTLPDFRGRAPYYLNGGTGRLTSAGAGIDGNTRFASGGNNGVTLLANQVPTISSSGTMTTSGGLSFPVVATFGEGSQTVVGASGSQFAPTDGATGWSYLNSMSGTLTYTNSSQQIIQSTTPGTVSGIRLIRAA